MSPRPVLGSLIAVVAAAFLWAANCSGPRPSVLSTRLFEPEQPGDPYRIEATVRNGGPGHGEVNLLFGLVDPAGGPPYLETKQVQLAPGETARVVAEVPAPEGNYQPKVEVEYPPR